MIPLVKPYLPSRDKLIPRLEKILYSGYIAEGDATLQFESQLCELIGNPYCLTVNSGTAALHIALKLVGIKEGDEVITTALTAEPTNTTIALTGAQVIFADIDIDTGLISPDSIEDNITPRTKAIMVVHYAGMVCDMNRINAIANKHNIPVIEDAAHAFCSRFKGQFIGNNSPYTCFSFQAIKQLTTIDGGLLCLKNEQEYHRARKLRWFGLDKKIPRADNNITEAGFKYHMNNVNATIGLVQLDCLMENVHRYIENGKYYDDHLRDIQGVTLMKYYQDTEPSYWLYTMKVDQRNSFIRMMAENGVASSPLHLRNDKHNVFNARLGRTPKLDIFYEQYIHIPCGWWVTDSDRENIVELIKGGW